MNAIEKRFWRKVRIGDGCWQWQASKHWKGYGHFKVRGKMKKANRVAWELERGPIPEGIHVCHRCDNPGCVRPSHLFLGTHADNSADMVAKERQARGEQNGRAKLTEEQVIAIRRSLRTNTDIACELGVHHTAVSQARLRKRWKHLPESPAERLARRARQWI